MDPIRTARRPSAVAREPRNRWALAKKHAWATSRLRKRSAIARMLSSSSMSGPARWYRGIAGVTIALSVVLHALSTVRALDHLDPIFYKAEAAFSFLFACDYAMRLWACGERRKYAEYGVLMARLRWSLSFEALLDLASWMPFVIDELVSPGFDSRDLPSLGWVRVFSADDDEGESSSSSSSSSGLGTAALVGIVAGAGALAIGSAILLRTFMARRVAGGSVKPAYDA